MTNTFTFESASLNTINETLQKLEIEGKGEILKTPIKEADGNYTSVVQTNDTFDPSKANALVSETDLDKDSEASEEKAKLTKKAVEKINQSLETNNELRDILQKIKELSKDIDTDKWVVNEEDNSAILKKKNARIFKQNDNLCLSHDNQVEIFKSVSELHDWLKKNNYPLPKNIKLHESVILAEEDDGIDIDKPDGKGKNENIALRFKTTYGDSPWAKILSHRWEELGNDAPDYAYNNISDEYAKTWKASGKLSRDDSAENLWKIGARRTKAGNKKIEDTIKNEEKEIKDLTAKIEEIQKQINNLHQNKNAELFDYVDTLNSYKRAIVNDLTSGIEKLKKAADSRASNFIKQILRDTVDFKMSSDDIKNALESMDSTKLKDKVTEVVETVDSEIAKVEKNNSEMFTKDKELSKELKYLESKKNEASQVLGNWKAILKEPKWNDIPSYHDYTVYDMSDEDFSAMFNRSPDSPFGLGREVIKKDPSAMPKKFNINKNAAEKARNKNTNEYNDLLKNVFGESDNQLDSDEIWYLEYKDNNLSDISYLAKDWRDADLLSTNLEDAAKFVSREDSLNELSELYALKDTQFPFEPLLLNDLDECGVTCAGLGAPVSWLGSKDNNLEEDLEPLDEKDTYIGYDDPDYPYKGKVYNGSHARAQRGIDYLNYHTAEGKGKPEFLKQAWDDKYYYDGVNHGGTALRNGREMYKNGKLKNAFANTIHPEIHSLGFSGLFDAEGEPLIKDPEEFKAKLKERVDFINNGLGLDFRADEPIFNHIDPVTKKLVKTKTSSPHNDAQKQAYYKKYIDDVLIPNSKEDTLRTYAGRLKTADVDQEYRNQFKTRYDQRTNDEIERLNAVYGKEKDVDADFNLSLKDIYSIADQDEREAALKKYYDNERAKAANSARAAAIGKAKETTPTKKLNNTELVNNLYDKFIDRVEHDEEATSLLTYINKNYAPNIKAELYQELSDWLDDYIEVEGYNPLMDEEKQLLAQLGGAKAANESFGQTFMNMVKGKTEDTLLTEEDTPADFATGAADTTATATDTTPEPASADKSIPNDEYAPDMPAEAGGQPSFGDININGGAPNQDLDGEAAPMPQENTRIVDVLVDTKDPSKIKVKLKKMDTNEITIKDLSEIDV